MSAVLDSLPAIEPALIDQTRTDVAVAAAEAIDLKKLDLATVALARFGDWRAAVAKLKTDNERTELDLSTQTKVDEAITLRARLIKQPLANARETARLLKSKLSDTSKAVGAELEAIVAGYDAAGQPLTVRIEAAQKRIDDDKEAKRLAEEARLQVLRDTVDAALAPWLERCTVEGITAERIGNGVKALQALPMPAELNDVSAHWTAQWAATLTAMGNLQRQAEAREEADRLEAQRLENERVAAEQKAEAERLANIRADLEFAEQKLHAKSAFDRAWDRCGAELAYACRDAHIALDPAGREVPREQYPAYIAALDALQPKPTPPADAGGLPAAGVAAADALQTDSSAGTAELPGHEPEAAPITPNAQESGSSPVDAPAIASSEPQAAQGSPSGCEGTGAHAEERAPVPLIEGDRFGRAVYDIVRGAGDSNPDVVAAMDLVRSRAVPAGLLARDGQQWPAPTAGLPVATAEPDPDPRAFVDLVLTLFEGKFPSTPKKPTESWWREVRTKGEALRAALGDGA